MPTIATSVCVEYTQDQMYALVNDIASYPRYLPMCKSVQVHSESARQVKATITLAKGNIRLHFTTANTMEPGKYIHMNLVEGPFKFLRGFWRFDPNVRGGCDVSLQLDFEFSNPLLRLALGGFFKEVVESLIDAFCKQAVERYGKPNGTTALQPMEQTGPA